MKRFIQDNGHLLVIIALLLAGIIFVISLFFGDPIGNLFGVITTPIRNGVSAVTNWAERRYENTYEVEAMRDELDRLRKELSDLQDQAREGERAIAENRNLRELLSLRKKRRDFVFEDATITAHALSNWESSFTISKGSAHGVEKDQCVIDPYGHFVGVVSEVGLNWSTVITVVDTGIEVGALMSRTDAAALLEGDFTLMKEGRVKLTYLPEGTEINAGDEVLTSGKGGVFPVGLVVGTVESVRDDPSGMTRYAVVAPAADLNDLQQVFVIKSFEIVE